MKNMGVMGFLVCLIGHIIGIGISRNIGISCEIGISHVMGFGYHGPTKCFMARKGSF